MYESNKHPLLTRRAFHLRLMRHMSITLVFTGLSLVAGVAGYHATEGLSWLNALLNASMILGGMGPVDVLKTDAGKLFASLYALYSGFFLIVCGGLLLAPVFHRILHKFHAEK